MSYFMNNIIQPLVFINLFFGFLSKATHVYFQVNYRGAKFSNIIEIYNTLLYSSFLSFEKSKNYKEKEVLKYVNLSTYAFLFSGCITAIILIFVYLKY